MAAMTRMREARPSGSIDAHPHIGGVGRFLQRPSRDAESRTTSLPDHHRVEVAPVAVVTHRFWQSHLGGTTDFKNRGFRTEFDRWVVGIMPPEMGFPDEIDLRYLVELRPRGGGGGGGRDQQT
ncbi:MAG: hypothetical protein SFU84_15185, partial [Gemmatimonadales bacterium]|nr:hypothetical protein [Gemmatimonadales bacterium]